METIVLPLPLLHSTLQLLGARPRQPLFLSVGLRRAANDRDWLARSISTERPVADGAAFFVVAGADALHAQVDQHIVGVLALGVGNERGTVSGQVRRGMRMHPLDRVSLVGAGMETLALTPYGQLDDAPDDVAHRERWSRTIGALGGVPTWRRLMRLRVAVVGAGRQGGLISLALVRLGLSVTLIDEDVVEWPDLGESDLFTEQDIGKAKVLALSQHLRELRPDSSVAILPISTSVRAPYALDALKRSDIIVSCVDRDAGRLMAGLAAVAHSRVLIDIGSSVFAEGLGKGDTSNRRLGADVRLILPGDGCILCRGGLSRYAEAIRTLMSRDEPHDNLVPGPGFPGGRAGSLRSWNALASSLGVRLLEDLVGGRVTRTTWIRIEDRTGRVESRYPLDGEAHQSPDACMGCARAGGGDAVL